jgi:hypothetical protein
MNQIIVEAASKTGAAIDGKFTTDEVIAMNQYIRQNYLAEWSVLHGDDDGDDETGYHLVQNDGGNLQFRGSNLINTVEDGIYHIGFAMQNGSFLNEDGNPNATVQQMANWLTALYTDHSTTGTGLDRITDAVMADGGLSGTISETQIETGANAANGLNQMILDAIKATGAMSDNWISETDVKAMNAWLRADADRLAKWTALHGDDDGTSETGFHSVVNDGGNTGQFGKNLINTVADGIYHLGFVIRGSNFVNEDGNSNAAVRDVANWLNYYLVDQSNTGTGLDKIVDTIQNDQGLGGGVYSKDINEGARCANELNKMLVEAIQATGAMADGWITEDDLRAMNTWLRSDPDRLDKWTTLHGDDGGEYEDGYHLVVNDGANTNYFGRNLVNTVADGIYHLGFEIQGNNFVNEDGDNNASLSDVATWLNYFYKGNTLIYGSDNSEVVNATTAAEEIVAYNGNDIIYAEGGDDRINGGYGNDTIYGGDGNDLITGGGNEDVMDGGEGSDTYIITGNVAGGWYSFQGYDTYSDEGTVGTDIIRAQGTGNVDIGLKQFGAGSGIETIDASGATGTVRLLGDEYNNVLDFRNTTLVGTNIVIDGGYGDDTIYGSAGADTIIGGGGNDTLNLGKGSDTYIVTGNVAGGWYSFQGYDAYADDGTSGTDTIKAMGDGNVDIGFKKFDASCGIEVIDASGAKGTVRLLGDEYGNILDFRNTTFIGTNIVIDGGYGDDIIYGSVNADTIMGGGGNDTLNLGKGSDTYLVTGNVAGGWSSFQGYDTYADNGTSGTDTIKALGDGNVDVGFKRFDASCGIEVIDASGAKGTVRLLGDDAANLLDFRNTKFIGTNIVIDGGYGDDIIYGSANADTIMGGGGNDTLNLGKGSDTYLVTGNVAGGWSSFQGYDTYADDGTSGTDTIKALGDGNVDIGFKKFDTSCGIEIVDASGAKGTVRLLGDDGANVLDFRTTKFIGTNIVIDGGYGDDSISGSANADTIIGGGGNDSLNGSTGSDTYIITGNMAGGWSSFQGYDLYADNGTTGTDTIKALGDGNVDIGLKKFDTSCGIEIIDGSGAKGTVRLVGDTAANVLDFRTTTFLGTNIIIDGDYGNDIISGSIGKDNIRGGEGNDIVIGNAGADTLNGGNGNDLIMDNRGNDLLVGEAGKDRFVLGYTDHSTVDLWGGNVGATGDATTDCFTLLNSKTGLDMSAIIHDFERGKDRIDLTQLRDADNNALGLDDLVITTTNGNTTVSFASGIHTIAGGAVNVQMVLQGVTSTLNAADFAFTDAQLPSGLPTVDQGLPYLIA